MYFSDAILVTILLFFFMKFFIEKVEMERFYAKHFAVALIPYFGLRVFINPFKGFWDFVSLFLCWILCLMIYNKIKPHYVKGDTKDFLGLTQEEQDEIDEKVGEVIVADDYVIEIYNDGEYIQFRETSPYYDDNSLSIKVDNIDALIKILKGAKNGLSESKR